VEPKTSNGVHMEIEEIKCVVRGQVQGVFYRGFAAEHAQYLALTGYARNALDHTVEIVAQGPKDKLEKFIEHLRKGSLQARVSEVDVEWRKPAERFSSFDVVL